MKLSSLALSGAALGAVSALVQLRTLPWGALGADQLAPFLAFHVGLGAALLLVLCALVRTLGMSARRTPWVAGGVLIGVLSVLGAVNRRPMPPVFLVLSDTTRADHLSLYGYARDTTPFLDELAWQSVVFEDAVSQGSHTIVTTPALLASCYPSEHGLVDYQDVLSEDHVLVSECFQAAGYYTFGLVTNPHVSARNGFAQGFANYEMLGKGNRESVFAEKLRPIVERKLDLHRPLWAEEGEGRADAPVFGFLFYTDPHAPYRSPGDWPRRFLEPRDPEPRTFEWKEDRSPETARLLIDQYDACIAYWDSELRELAASLEERQLWSRALVVYTSDHGEEFLEHGGIAHGGTLYEEAIHVPLLVSFPVPVRFPPLARTTRRVRALTASIDVVPTVLDYLRLPPLPEARGISQADVALGLRSGDPDRSVILEEALDHYQTYELQAVRTPRYKFIRVLKSSDGAPEAPELFFDLALDPAETENRVTVEPERADRFRGALAEHAESVGHRPRGKPDRIVPDQEQLDQLRALGYVD
jgi:arylsulfatase A-like enzyme